MSELIRFSMADEPANLRALRQEVRGFIKDQMACGAMVPSPYGWAEPNAAFSRALGQKKWIGMTWPSVYGGHERSAIERFVVTEELLAAGAPIRAHWVADRQSGPLLLKFGTEAQKQAFLPRIARGECFFCIGMSEPDSGSDLASIRTKAEKVEGGWKVTGTKIWTSNAHRVDMMILFVRTGPRGESRREGVSQFLVDLTLPGITIRPIINLAGEHDFNEVIFEEAFIPDDMVIGTIENGWKQVTNELVYERSGPDRWTSTFHVLDAMRSLVRRHPSATRQAEVARLTARLWTLHQMSTSVAGMLENGEVPNTEAALVKDLGTTFEQDIPEVARKIFPEELRETDEDFAQFNEALRYCTLYAPGYTLRGGTKEILRGIIAKSLGLK
ncbi:acyl-CoA dehydrogenase family protein [Pusillimonas sp. MFBS29]|uniref:acyl-CoA dehydrogenase family protein n=1 Tax=Pusillimonas sp. MFBS29 TaxID=2886690 RepID=UPI001D10387F|nr:acyl-CoA dehydrogenase family protein [Pusillimonas sp. MFBS29]MCC2594856.1 acyl-CoA dehydrogenase family protein [Pusillimonas sp. MFBS29]